MAELLPPHVRGLAPVRIGRRASEDLESLCTDLVSRRLAQVGEESTDVYNQVINVVEKELILQVLRQSQGRANTNRDPTRYQSQHATQEDRRSPVGIRGSIVVREIFIWCRMAFLPVAGLSDKNVAIRN